MPTGLAGGAALVTGAGSGIGRAAAQALAAEGMRVVVTDLDGDRAVETAATLEGTGHRAMRHDVTAAGDWAAAVAAAEAAAEFRVMVCSAGISAASDIHVTSFDSWRAVFAVNVDGFFLGLAAVLPALRRHGHGGSVINVSSASGIKAAPGAAAYSASKAAAIMLARVAALECARDATRIRVNTVAPGAVRTPIWRAMPFFEDLIRQHGSEDAAWRALEATMPQGRFAEPAEVAAAIVYLASEEARYVTGTELVLDGGYTA